MDVDDALLRVAEPGFLDVVGQAGLRVVATQGLEVVVDALEADAPRVRELSYDGINLKNKL